MGGPLKKIYAETPVLRTRQLVLDVGSAAWTALWIYAGLKIYELIERLTGPADSISRAGADIRQGLTSAGERVSQIPVVGESLQGSLQSAAGAGQFMQEAGAAQSENFHALALLLGISIGVIPVFLLLLRYLPGRISWVREASAAARYRVAEPSLELFAFRAITNLPLYELEKVSSDPMSDIREGRHRAIAELELTRLGLRVGTEAAS
ncbi:MAG TPA: hypothetical protein VND22_05280 [Actinomycetota bacterium]|nr:hypothetical protein [Actinomycetota bacterium]